MIAIEIGLNKKTAILSTFFQLFVIFFSFARGDCCIGGANPNRRIRGGSSANGYYATDGANGSASRTQRNTGTVEAVYDLIDRVLQDPKAKNWISLQIVDQEGGNFSSQKKQSDKMPWFRLEERERTIHRQVVGEDIFDLDVHTNNTVIVVTATSASELTAGLGYYFKHVCNFTLEWSTGGRAGGSHIVMPDIWPVPLEHDKKTITRYRTTKWSYLMNVCTHSYSLVWYDWTAWQSLIDNMALRGINMVLALTGQEEIQYKVFSSLGLKDQDIRSWFNGPAFLTWSRGQNEYGNDIAGPLPRSFMKSQWSLQREFILPRLRSLGMIGILPAFQGNVPIQLKALCNDTNITQQGDTGWIDALDPLFLHIADLWMTILIEDFGTDHYYQLDGWFNGGVPPWMNGLNKTKHDVTATQRRALANRNSLNNKTSKATVSPVAHDENWYRRGRAAYSGLNRTDPNAHWMYQGFAFVGWKTSKEASYVKGFVDSAPHGKFIVIDMEYSSDGEWQKWGNSSFFGAPFIWSKLHNFGDTSGLRGDIANINTKFPFQALEAHSSIIGLGATPEGIDQNPIYYDFLYEQNFRQEPVKNLTMYLIHQNHKRYGLQETNEDIFEAWTNLLRSSYSQDFSVQDLTAVAHLNPRPSSSFFEGDRKTPKAILCSMYKAWISLIHFTENRSQLTDPFLYDLVNVGREVIAQLSIPMALNFSDALSRESMNRAELVRTGGLYVSLLLDLDRLLGTNKAFLLSPWLQSARRLAQEDATGNDHGDCFSPILKNRSNAGCCSCFYEFNARVQITTWNPTPYGAGRVPSGPVDYAAKHWSGLIDSYYAKRAKILLQQALRDQGNDQPLNSTEVEQAFATHAYEWATAVKDGELKAPDGPSLIGGHPREIKETVQTSKEMLQKYSHWFRVCN